MKKLLTPFTALLLLLFISANSFTQNTVKISTFSKPENQASWQTDSMSSNLKSIESLTAAKFGARALKHFNNMFPAVTNVSWYVDKNTISTYSKQDDVSTRVTYNKKGFWLHTFIYSPGDKLAPSMRSIISSSYPDYDILGTIEIHEHDLVFHVVNIENKREIKQLIVHNGKLLLHDEFDRAD